MWMGSQLKSQGELDRLVHEVLLVPGFNIDDIQKFNAHHETAMLDSVGITCSPSWSDPSMLATPLSLQDVWRETAVQIPVPDGQPHNSPQATETPHFEAMGLHHHSITQTIKLAWTDHTGSSLHLNSSHFNISGSASLALLNQFVTKYIPVKLLFKHMKLCRTCLLSQDVHWSVQYVCSCSGPTQLILLHLVHRLYGRSTSHLGIN